MCISHPITGEVITDIEMIKEVSINILTKNKLREQDRKELKDKEENHNKIMAIDNKDEWELDKGLIQKSSRKKKKKGKKMFKLRNNWEKKAWHWP